MKAGPDFKRELHEQLERGCERLIYNLAMYAVRQLEEHTRDAGYDDTHIIEVIDMNEIREKNNCYATEVYYNTDRLPVLTGIFPLKVKGRHVNVAYGINQSAYGKDVRNRIVEWLEEGTRATKPRAYTSVPPARGSKPVGYHHYPAKKPGYMIGDTMEDIIDSAIEIADQVFT